MDDKQRHIDDISTLKMFRSRAIGARDVLQRLLKAGSEDSLVTVLLEDALKEIETLTNSINELTIMINESEV